MEQSRETYPPDGLSTHLSRDDEYVLGEDGIHRPRTPVHHRDHEYPSDGFQSLLAIQQQHFWYRGRHRFILRFTRKITARLGSRRDLEAIDLGGGCGGWVRYVQQHAPALFSEIALGDSSADALDMAAPVVSARVKRFQIDLLDLHWHERWDVAFMLDVLEHLDDDVRVLRQVRAALRPGGFLVVTTPALERFRTPIDEMSGHVRRYSRCDLADKAQRVGYELVTSRYFMFFLSPLLLLSRRKVPAAAELTPGDVREYLRRSSQMPPAPLNAVLAGVFWLESPLGDWIPFPWGTSVLAVFRRPP